MFESGTESLSNSGFNLQQITYRATYIPISTPTDRSPACL